MPNKKKITANKEESLFPSKITSLDFTKSYTSLFYGVVTVILLFILVMLGFQLFSQKGSSKNITDSGAKVVKQENKSNTQAKLTKTYTVAKGDNLWKISEKYYKSGYNWVDIAKANKLTNPGVINEGAKLTIPEVQAKTITAVVKKVEQPNVSNLQKISGNSYTIQKGDNLWNISVRAYGDGYKWVEIAKANKLSNPNLIHSGNKLTLTR